MSAFWFRESGNGDHQPVILAPQDPNLPASVRLPDGTLLVCANKADARALAALIDVLVLRQLTPEESS